MKRKHLILLSHFPIASVYPVIKFTLFSPLIFFLGKKELHIFFLDVAFYHFFSEWIIMIVSFVSFRMIWAIFNLSFLALFSFQTITQQSPRGVLCWSVSFSDTALNVRALKDCFMLPQVSTSWSTSVWGTFLEPGRTMDKVLTFALVPCLLCSKRSEWPITIALEALLKTVMQNIWSDISYVCRRVNVRSLFAIDTWWDHMVSQFTNRNEIILPATIRVHFQYMPTDSSKSWNVGPLKWFIAQLFQRLWWNYISTESKHPHSKSELCQRQQYYCSVSSAGTCFHKGCLMSTPLSPPSSSERPHGEKTGTCGRSLTNTEYHRW